LKLRLATEAPKQKKWRKRSKSLFSTGIFPKNERPDQFRPIFSFDFYSASSLLAEFTTGVSYIFTVRKFVIYPTALPLCPLTKALLHPANHLADEDRGRGLTAVDFDAPGPNSRKDVRNFTSVLDLDQGDAEAHGLRHVGVAARHHRKPSPLGLSFCPPIRDPEDVLGVVDLNGVAVRYAVHGVPEDVVGMGDDGDPAPVVNELDRLLGASPPRWKVSYSQDQKVATGGGDLDSGDHQKIEVSISDDPLGFEGAFQGVVVGDGDPVELFRDRRLQDLIDPVPSVRAARMDVEVEPEMPF